MDIENTWQQNERSDEDLQRLLQVGQIEKLQSRHPLKKLKWSLLAGIVWAVVITVGYVVLFFFISIWQVHLLFCILVVFNCWILVGAWKIYRDMDESIVPLQSLKAELQRNYNSIHKWWEVQEKVSLFVYPFALTAGFMVGASLGSGEAMENFLYSTKGLLILGGIIIVFVPLLYFAARWMYNASYGRHMKKLKELIEELK